MDSCQGHYNRNVLKRQEKTSQSKRKTTQIKPTQKLLYKSNNRKIAFD